MIRVLRLVWTCSPSLTLVMILTTTLQGLLPAASAYTVKLIVDCTIQALDTPDLGLGNVLPAVALALGLALLAVLLRHSRQLSQELLGDLLSNRINEMIIERALALDLSFYENPEFYDMLRRAQDEAGFRPLAVVMNLLVTMSSSITTVSLLVLLVRFNPIMALLLVITVLPALLIQTRYGREAFRLLNWRTPEARELAYYKSLLTSDRSVKEVKLLNLGALLLDRYRTIFARFYLQNQELVMRRTLSSAILSLLSNLGYYGCYVYVIRQTLVGAATLGDLTLYASIFQQLQSTLGGLFDALSSIYENALFIRNLFTFLDLRSLINPCQEDRHPPGTWQEGFTLHNVSFCYPGTTKCILDNVNLHLRPGEKVALVGKNGTGKTTLVKLLCRLYDPTSGYITLEGVDLREYDPVSLQRHIGVIFQDFVHYYLTAQENIGFGQLEAMDDDSRVAEAAEKSGAHEVINALPAGYNTRLGRWFDGGQQLSLGEWQKVALARVFMRDADLLILDEPTASLDAQTEYKVFQQFAELTRDRMVILISHRFSTVRLADRIVVLNDGKIVEDGTHQQLIEQDGLYATLFHIQAKGYQQQQHEPVYPTGS